MSNDDSREEVPMTAELVDDVTLRMPLSRGWTWGDPERLPERDGHRYEILDGSLIVSASSTPWRQLVAGELSAVLRAARPAGTVPAGEAVPVDRPFAVELRPAELVMPGRED